MLLQINLAKLFGSLLVLNWLTCVCICRLQLLNNQLSSDDDCTSDVANSLAQFTAQPMTADEAALLNSRLLHSEETQKDIKEELSKMRHDCIKRQGAEVSHFCAFCLSE